MSKKTAKKATPKTATITTLTFEKNAYYEDAKGDLWLCTNGKIRKSPDGHTVVDMRSAPGGNATGEPGEEYADQFVKKLSAKDIKEVRDVAKREADALADAAALKTTDATSKEGKKTKTPKAAKPKAEKAPGKLSAIDAAAKVLGESGTPMSTKEMIDAMAAKGYWTSPGGKTPAATLYSAILREVATKGGESRFVKTERGRFALNGTTASEPAAAPETTTAPGASKKSKKKADATASAS